ncbi:unnamed protein product, partial [Dovyalis caffra]
ISPSAPPAPSTSPTNTHTCLLAPPHANNSYAGRVALTHAPALPLAPRPNSSSGVSAGDAGSTPAACQ